MTEESTPDAYLRVLIRHLEDVGVSGGVHHVDVLHDDWCGIFDGGRCDCEPDVVSGPLVDEKYDLGGGSSDE